MKNVQRKDNTVLGIIIPVLVILAWAFSLIRLVISVNGDWYTFVHYSLAYAVFDVIAIIAAIIVLIVTLLNKKVLGITVAFPFILEALNVIMGVIVTMVLYYEYSYNAAYIAGQIIASLLMILVAVLAFITFSNPNRGTQITAIVLIALCIVFTIIGSASYFRFSYGMYKIFHILNILFSIAAFGVAIAALAASFKFPQKPKPAFTPAPYPQQPYTPAQQFPQQPYTPPAPQYPQQPYTPAQQYPQQPYTPPAQQYNPAAPYQGPQNNNY